MIEKIKGAYCGKEKSIGPGEGAVVTQGLIFNRTIGGNNREDEKYRYKKKRYSFLDDSLHGQIILRRKVIVKILFQTETVNNFLRQNKMQIF